MIIIILLLPYHRRITFPGLFEKDNVAKALMIEDAFAKSILAWLDSGKGDLETDEVSSFCRRPCPRDRSQMISSNSTQVNHVPPPPHLRAYSFLLS